MRFAAIAIACLLVGACNTTGTTTGTAAAPKPAPPKEGVVEKAVVARLTAAELATIKSTVARQLKDPESARFGKIYAQLNTGNHIKTVCVFVNARNSFGGYTGEQPVAGSLKGGRFEIISWNDFGANIFCKMILDVHMKEAVGG